MKKTYILIYSLLFYISLVLFSCSKTEEDYTPIKDTLPVASDDVINSVLINLIEIPVLNNDKSGDPIIEKSLSLVGGLDTDGNQTLDKLTIAGEGIWQVNELGIVSFKADTNFSGNPTPIKYTGKDLENNVSNIANIAINVVQIANADLTLVPYPKLSNYKFFVGDIKEQLPSMNVLPYEPASSLFTDYAHKKRFVWMPPATKATYNGDSKTLELPVGAALIKTFYYENVQNVTLIGSKRIIETRIMIRLPSGWIFADYVWNTSQTEAYYDTSGSNTDVSWIDENNVSKNVSYRIPNQVQCITCHKVKINGIETNTPIGIKPQNLNYNYNYSTETKNQLTKWIDEGYLTSGFTYPAVQNTAVDYKDTSKSIELRARSYVDINCAHCHQNDRHCDYRPMRFAFAESGLPNGVGTTNMGVCVATSDMQDFPIQLNKVVAPANINASMMYYRLNTTNEAYRMPLHGRTLIHTEGVALIADWINSLQPCR
jgi:uncharacterized repeat protein (TIGR03806 family)